MFDIGKLGMHIGVLRREKNLTQVDLADRMGVSFQAVSNWERGNSAPDIAKLQELSLVLGVTVDRLLEGAPPLLEHAVDGTAEEYLRGNPLPVRDILEVAPMLKPDQYEPFFARVEGDVDLEELCGIAPFVSQETMDRLAERVAEVSGIEVLCGIAPFVSQETMDRLAERVAEVSGIEVLCGIAPFVSRETMDRLAERVAEISGIGELCGIAPFVSREILDRLAAQNKKT